MIIDEVQRAPDLLSYIQVEVDEDATPSRYVLTGSQNLALNQAVSQSLAGRTALLQLLPLSFDEIKRFERPPGDRATTIWTGGYPRIYDRQLPAAEWLADYTNTYVERDVRQILNVGDLVSFQTFLRLCAGRAGQLLSLSGLGADAGISHVTAKRWLSVLEAGFVVFRLLPHHRNLGKRLVKSPKLYFYDTGLACNLLGIEEPKQLETHPLRGAIFENWVIAEIVKHIRHRGRTPRIHFHRDRRGHEVDLLIEIGPRLSAVEIKSASTPASDFFAGLTRFRGLLGQAADDAYSSFEPVVVYGGSETQERRAGLLLPWDSVDAHGWAG
jgi:predicted AAA+ superfamily ATPase